MCIRLSNDVRVPWCLVLYHNINVLHSTDVCAASPRAVLQDNICHVRVRHLVRYSSLSWTVEKQEQESLIGTFALVAHLVHKMVIVSAVRIFSRC